MKTAAIIPVKTFSRAKTRLALPPRQRDELCRAMLEEVVRTVTVSPRIARTVVVTGDQEAAAIGRGHGATIIKDALTLD